MSNVNDNIVNFDALELEGDDEGNNASQKLMNHVKFLKEKLSPEDYSKAVKDLGFDTALSNEQLLEEIKGLLTNLANKDGEGEEEEGDLMPYKDFIAKCMGEGKALKDCSAEYKEKYPEAEEPSKEEQTELEKLEKDLVKKKKPEDEYPEADKKFKALSDELAQLREDIQVLSTARTQEKNTEELTLEVDKLIEEKHLAPSQRAGIIKLAGGMSPGDQQEMLTFFRTTQKLGGLFDDKGFMANTSASNPIDISPARKAELLKIYKIDEIIEDRGVKPRRNN